MQCSFSKLDDFVEVPFSRFFAVAIESRYIFVRVMPLYIYAIPVCDACTILTRAQCWSTNSECDYNSIILTQNNHCAWCDAITLSLVYGEMLTQFTPQCVHYHCGVMPTCTILHCVCVGVWCSLAIALLCDAGTVPPCVVRVGLIK